MNEAKVQLVALVSVEEKDGEGNIKRFPNGAIFLCSQESADYYLMSGYARKLTEEEAAAASRLPKPKAPPVDPVIPKATRDMTPKGPSGTMDVDNPAAATPRPATGRGSRRSTLTR